VIVRVSEASVRAGRLGAFLRRLQAEVGPYRERFDGLLSDEVLTDGETAVLYVSRWRDEAALEAFAGPDWRTAPVTFDDEDSYLSSPLRVRHFSVHAVPR
jgi:heme-degrading monooxygenase HmoA